MKKSSLFLFLFGFLLTCNPSKLTAAAAVKDPSTENPYLSPKEVMLYPILAGFVEHYALPEPYRASFAKNKHLHDQQKEIGKIKDLPFYKKRADIFRIINAQRMKNCIKKMNLYHLNVTEKYIARSDEFWAVLSQEVEGHPLTQKTPPPIKFNQEIAKQLYTLTQETGFCDWGNAAPNWILGANNVLVCIDTDPNAFSESVLEGVDELCNSWENFFTEEAFAFLEDKKNTLADLEVDNPQPPFESYDDPAISFTETIKEFYALKCAKME